MSKTKHKDTSLQAIRNRAFSHAGYATLGLLWLQALSLLVIAVLQYGVFNHISTDQNHDTTATISLESLFASYTQPLHEARPQEPNTVLTVFLWTALTVIIVLISVYITKILSAIVHAITKKLYGKVTLHRLLIIKLLSACTAFFAVAGSALILPAIEDIMPLNILIVAVCLMTFIAQHTLAKHTKTPAKNIP